MKKPILYLCLGLLMVSCSGQNKEIEKTINNQQKIIKKI